MYSSDVRRRAAELRARGATWAQISRALGVHRSTLRDWASGRSERTNDCPACGSEPLHEEAYAALLGFYLGDGCISKAPRSHFLRISCDASLPGIIDDVTRCIRDVRPGGRVFHVQAPGTVAVQSNWQHWPCLFPQRGPGRKHERPIVLEDWQRRVVEAHPAAFLRALCCWALDLIGVPWRQSGARVISVSRRDAVARRDGLIGLKS